MSLCAVLLSGGALQAAVKKYPFLNDVIHVIDNPHVAPTVDINSAGAQELERIPYIGAYTAEKIVAYRKINGPFKQIDDIKNVEGIRDKNFERFRSYLRVGR